MSNSGIYQIVNKVNGVKYIGSTNNFTARFNNHKRLLRNNLHDNKYLQNSWNKYTEDNFLFQIVEYCVPKLLLKREQDYIDCFVPFDRKEIFNLCLIVNSPTGIKRSEEAKLKYSLSKQGNKNPMFGMCGEKAPFSKISDIERNKIFDMCNSLIYTQKEIGQLFNISQTQVGKIYRSIQQKLGLILPAKRTRRKNPQ
jgi:group I intron endonuclease